MKKEHKEKQLKEIEAIINKYFSGSRGAFLKCPPAIYEYCLSETKLFDQLLECLKGAVISWKGVEMMGTITVVHSPEWFTKAESLLKQIEQ